MFTRLQRMMRALTAPPPEQSREDHIHGLHMAAGDTLIINCERILTPEQRAQIASMAARRLREGVHVMVLDGGLKVSAVHTQPSIDAQARLLAELQKNTAALRTIADAGIDRALGAAV